MAGQRQGQQDQLKAELQIGIVFPPLSMSMMSSPLRCNRLIQVITPGVSAETRAGKKTAEPTPRSQGKSIER
jgi:hypothetical protein